MKLFANKKIFKKIVIMLVTIMMITTLMPLHQVSADADEDFGGKLFRPIMQFFAGIGDLAMEGLQWIFIGDAEIKTDEIWLLGTGQYVIRYSPGVIFSNNVPGLDANFIDPMDDVDVTSIKGTTTEIGKWTVTDKTSVEYSLKPELRRYGYDENTVTYRTTNVNPGWFNAAKINYIWEWKDPTNELKTYMLIIQVLNVEDMQNDPLSYSGLIKEMDVLATMFGSSQAYLYEIDNSVIKSGETLQSTAAQLQGTVAKWYKALRLVALVALLSVLVYVGIRIIISSTGQEKAKYKKMIGDWVAAICVLFVLNYIMAFTMDIVSKVTEVFSVNVIDAQGVDTLMSGIRNCIDSNQFSGFTTFTYLILYLVLVVYTVIFTIHYLKRVVYLAFFTMIAPLIAVTYPIDKIKDGQAQAFGTWIKEYTFNAAIPVIHIIIYSVLVGSAADLAQKNPLYAIVCISFLIPAEKFFKKLFGFDKASTVSQLGAAAGGALIMNAINKMGHKSGRQAAEKAGRGGNAPRISRTPSANAAMIGVGASGGESPDGGAPVGGSPVGGAPVGGAPAGGTPAGGIPAGGSPGRGTPSGGTPGGSSPGGGSPAGGSSGGGIPSGGTMGSLGTIRNASKYGPTMKRALTSPKGIRNGLQAVGRRFVNTNNLKKVGRLARKGIVGVAGAGLGATAGLVAGISTGDFSNAIKYGAAGAGAGFLGSNYVGDKVVSAEKSVRETFKEGAIGQEEYANIKADKEFYQSAEFKNMVNNRDLLPDKQGKGRTAAMRKEIQTYRDNGVTDTGKISTAMRLGLDAQQGAYAIRLADMIGRSGWNNKNVREDFEKRYRGNIPSGADANKIWNSIESLL